MVLRVLVASAAFAFAVPAFAAGNPFQVSQDTASFRAAYDSCAISKMILLGKSASVDALTNTALDGCRDEGKAADEALKRAMDDDDGPASLAQWTLVIDLNGGSITDRTRKLASDYKAGTN